MPELIALKKCGKHNPGDVFFEQPGKAKLLIAIKSAKLAEEEIKEPETYQTRNLIAEQQVIDMPKRRGRPPRIVIEESIEESE